MSDQMPPDPDLILPDEPSLLDSIIGAFGEVEIRAEDAGTVRLAKQYAAMIDADPDQLDKLGPGLLRVLDALGMTPRSRAAMTSKGGGPGGQRNPLDALREQRAAHRAGQSDA